MTAVPTNGNGRHDPMALAQAHDQRRPRCESRGHNIVGKLIGWGKNHFLIAHHEPQADGAVIAILRRRRDFDVPDHAVLGGGGSAGDSHGFTLIYLGQSLVRNVDGQPPPVVFEEIREDLDLEIAGIDTVGTRERANDERGLGRRQRHGAVLKNKHPAGGVGRRQRCLCRTPTGRQEQ
jgi:hypothetical protein